MVLVAPVEDSGPDGHVRNQVREIGSGPVRELGRVAEFAADLDRKALECLTRCDDDRVGH